MAARGKKAKEQPAEKRPVGRPTLFRPEYVDQARMLCELGATDADLARFFGVEPRTINYWKEAHPEFLQSVKSAKADLDAQVEQSLFRRAMGYSHEAVKIFADVKSGATTVVPYTEHYPPDATSMIFWLKNRQPERWRERNEVKHEVTHRIAGMTPEERHQRATELSEKATLLLPDASS